MTLAARLNVNGRSIGELSIQRVRSSNNGVHDYTVTSVIDGREQEAHFKHRSGDGPLICFRLAIEALDATAAGVGSPRIDRIN